MTTRSAKQEGNNARVNRAQTALALHRHRCSHQSRMDRSVGVPPHDCQTGFPALMYLAAPPLVVEVGNHPAMGAFPSIDAGNTWGFGRRWDSTSPVHRFPALT